jgi:prepilin-type N-terminal cleavage/methylation domain-containing protein/prepilin-type processing-associated H-X9-DG protein
MKVIRLCRRGSKPSRAFTLLEIVIVVAVLALLMAILLPSLGVARRQARAIQCLANVRQLNTAFGAYRAAHDGQSLVYNLGRQLWVRELKRHFDAIDQARFCPDATDPSIRPGGLDPYGTATTSWGPATGTIAQGWMGSAAGSYAFNGWLYRQGPGLSLYSTNPREFVQPMSERIDQSETPTFSDGAWIDAWPLPANSVPTDLDNPLYGTGPSNGNMGRVCLNRHDKRMSVSFLDGSARRVPLAQLWQLRWTATWVGRDVVVP